MKLAKREIYVIAGGAALLAGAIGHRVWSSRAASAAAQDEIPGALARIRQTGALKKSVESIADELGVQIPDVPSGEQEGRIRENLGSLAQASGMVLRSVRRTADTSHSKSGPLKPIEFRLDLVGPFDSLMKYVFALEHAPTPYVVAEANIDSTSRRSRQSDEPPPIPTPPPTPPPPGMEAEMPEPPLPTGPGVVRATMKVQSYIFPEVVLAPKAPTPAPTETPTATDAPARPGEATPAPAASPAHEEKADPPTRKTRRKEAKP